MLTKNSIIKLPGTLVLQARSPIPLYLLEKNQYPKWHKAQNKAAQNWLRASGLEAGSKSFLAIPGANGAIDRVVALYEKKPTPWQLADLPKNLAGGVYAIANEKDFTSRQLQDLCLGWALGQYQFSRYKKPSQAVNAAKLLCPSGVDTAHIASAASATFLVRDLINTPANDMGPDGLEQAARKLADACKASIKVIAGNDLLKKNYPLIHAVGRAAAEPPRLIDIEWGNPKYKRVTLVGKGVCFDTGGLDIKSADGMLLMKKDMGGAAHVLGLAQMIIAARLKLRLRVLIPAVENSISSNAFRPSDIIRARKGITVEIGNTDAEGRLVLADALTEACAQNPDLLIDCATLTGAARVALGTDLPALFCNDDKIAEELQKESIICADPLWRMPLWEGYRPMLDSKAADINNAPAGGYGGAITAALFLKEFIDPKVPWAHIDMMAWNIAAKPGRPQGGEAMGMRALFSLLQNRYGHA